MLRYPRRASRTAGPSSPTSKIGCYGPWPNTKIFAVAASASARMPSGSPRRSWSKTCCRRRIGLSRALENIPPGHDALQSLLAGVALTERALRDAFIKHGIQKIQPAPGEPFDPHRHQALFEVEDDDLPPGIVAEILQPGYAYYERLLRPALVGVAKRRTAQTQERHG